MSDVRTVSDVRTGADIRLIGHWRRIRVTVLVLAVLLLVQWPMRHAVQLGDPTWATRWGATGDIPPCVVPARLSLLVDGVFIYVYVLAAWRTRAYLDLRATRARSMLGLVGAALLSVAAVLDVVENVVLWRRFGAVEVPPAAGLPGQCPALDVTVLSQALDLLWVGGVVVLLVGLVLAVASRRARDTRSGTSARPEAVEDCPGNPSAGRADGAHADTAGAAGGMRLDAVDDEVDRGGQIICCSGGGIRSAAFSLGALQVLSERGEYQRSSSVIGVSGGSYIAAAFHVLRRSLTGRPGERPPFALGSPELARLRRHTHYLLPSISVGVRGVMSLLYGAVVNLVLIGVVLRVTAWLLGWAIAETGSLDGLGTSRASFDVASLPGWYLAGALGPLAIVVVLFLLEVVVDRFRVPPTWLRTEGRALAQMLTVPGLVAAALLLGVPAALAWANNVELEQKVAPSLVGAGVASGLMGAANGVPSPGGSGAEAAVLDSQFGFTTLVTLGLTFIALARSAWKGLEALDSGDEGPGLRATLAVWVRTRLVPWVGSTLLVLAGVVILLRWTAGYVTSEEWRSRWWVAALCVGAVVVIGVVTDATRTSLHPYYRERLASAYLVRRVGDDAVDEYDYARPMPYSSWAAASDEGPRLVVVASANAFDREFVPPDRGCVPFIFDPDVTGVAGGLGLPDGGLEPTAAYEERADYRRREVTVAGAVAISGAAFAPLTGRENTRLRPMRLLFAVVNARLGVWLPNPYWGTASRSVRFAHRCADLATRGRPAGRLAWKLSGLWAHLVSVADKPGAFRLFKEAVGRTSLYDRRLYVTDGGHYDNLGLVEALRRRPARVIVIDASNDAEDTFAALGSAIATARMDLGVHVDLDPRRLRRADEPRVDRGWVRGRAWYPDGTSAEILLVKAVLAGRLPWDVEAYAAAHADFPRRTTGDQLYGEFDFEAYRALGYAVTRDMLDYLAARSLVPAGAASSDAASPSRRRGDTGPASPMRENTGRENTARENVGTEDIASQDTGSHGTGLQGTQGTGPQDIGAGNTGPDNTGPDNAEVASTKAEGPEDTALAEPSSGHG